MTLSLSLFPLGWQHYLAGGLLAGAGVALLFVLTGRIGGMSTVFSSTWSYAVQRPFFQQARFVDSRGWRLVYAAGLILGALLWWLGVAGGQPQATAVPTWQLVVGGFFVGYGARLGNGCTSGHGICGLGSLQLALSDGGGDLHGHGLSHGQPGGEVAAMSAAPGLAKPAPAAAPKREATPASPVSLFRALATLASGALFGFGLSYAGMIRPEVVLSFLRFQDWGLLLVMGGAVMVVVLVYQLAPRLMARPVLDDHFHRHPSSWNRDTALGAALFGVGWGLCGVCPGPAIAGLGTGNWDLLWALGGISLGALAHGLRAR
jgi:uncharacterized membrane protein YedE/YeeE